MVDLDPAMASSESREVYQTPAGDICLPYVIRFGWMRIPLCRDPSSQFVIGETEYGLVSTLLRGRC